MSRARRIAGFPAGRRSKYLVLAFWVVALFTAGGLAGKMGDVLKDDTVNWLPGSAESTQVFERSEAFSPKDVFTAVVVYERTSGLTPADTAKATADVAKLSALPGAGRVTGPVPAKDGQALQVLVPVDLGEDGFSKASGVRKQISGIATAGAAGVSVAITGPLADAADAADAFSGLDGVLLLATVLVVIVLLLVTYRSPTLWLLPVVSAGIALTSAQGVVYLLAKNAGLTVNSQSASILTVLVFGAGTDYALLLVARYREELRRHADRHEAMREALRRSGAAIVASAATVAAGMLTLSFAQMNSTKGLGPVLAVGIAVGLLAMVTLLPALLVICGRWLFWPARPKLGSAEPTEAGVWARVGRRIAVRPRVVWVVTALVLGALALGTTGFHAKGLTTAEAYTKDVASVQGAQVLDRHFPAGAGSPVTVVGRAGSADAIRAALSGVDGIGEVTAPVVKGGLAYVEGTLTSAPDSAAAFDAVDRARAAVHAVPGADAKVGGFSAITLDIKRATEHDRNLIIPLVLGVVFVILLLLLRAVVAPLVLIGTVVVSFAAALGLSALVFRHVFGWSSADTSYPLFVFVFLVALGIDYNIFLMTRVREEAQRHGTERAALTGLATTGAVITSAGLVLAGTFLVLGTLPLVQFAELGFAVAVGVLLDTLVVRSVLVTALNLDLGSRIWWPSALARRPVPVPPVDQEPEEEDRALVA